MSATLAPRPWRVREFDQAESYGLGWWTDAVAIEDADGGIVAVLTRGYEDGPSYTNARAIVDAVNGLPDQL